MDETDKTKKPAPPYLSWKTFIGFIKTFEQGLPTRLDKSAMNRLNGQNQNLTTNALLYLNLMNADLKPLPLLEQIVDSLSPDKQAEYKMLLQKMIKNSYTFLFDGTGDFDLERSTSAQFDEQFREEGVSGETIQKCEAFFLSAAADAGMKISRHILDAKRKGPKRVSGGAPRPKLMRNDGKQHDPPPPPADYQPPAQELSGWYITYKPAFDLLPKFSTSPRPKWAVQDEENFLNLVKALTTAYIEREDKKKA